MRSLHFHPSALKELHSYPPKHYKQVVGKVFSLLSDPAPQDARLLRGREDGMYRVTSGEYRIAYRFTDEELFIEAIGARNDDEIYKKLERRF